MARRGKFKFSDLVRLILDICGINVTGKFSKPSFEHDFVTIILIPAMLPLEHLTDPNQEYSVCIIW